MKKNENITLPTTSEIEELYKKAKYRKLLSEKIRSTVFMLIVVAAFAILVAMLYLPTLRIYGKSMKGTLESGDIVLAVKSNRFKTGDVVAFYYNNNILVKRVIAESGDWVNITKDGTVYVNDKKINEPYIENKAYGETNIKFPYQVPENRIFVLGDNRKVSIDSRNTSVGAVSDEQLVGKLIFRIWPLSDIGTLN
ncbi:MAG: signal peptidase I [Streptococcus sp.]|nr:signal peptidase I [Streptococcus sp.]